MRSTTFILIGQAIWAIAQALIVVVVSRTGGLNLVGLLVLGLGIFSPACLLMGLNLRALIAIDNTGSIDIINAIRVRFLSITIALVFTGAVLWMIGDGVWDDWLVIILLVASRASDQSADIAIGYYQRTNRPFRIGLSFSLRGVASILPFAITIYLTGNLVTSAIVNLAAMVFVHLLIDIVPIWRSAQRSHIGGLRSFLGNLGMGLASAPYPFLDSLLINSLRYAVVALLSKEILGLVGIAQTLYAPFQLMFSAIGFSFLPRMRALVTGGSLEEQLRHLAKGVGLVIAGGLVFLIAAAVVPAHWLFLVFHADGEALKIVLITIALTVLPLPVAGFITFTRLARNEVAIMSISVAIPICVLVIGLTTFWLVAPDTIALWHVALASFLCYTLRIVILLAPGFPRAIRS